MTFRRRRDGSWRLEREVEVESDWGWAPPGSDPKKDARPLIQKNAWFWDENQTAPHVITPDVYARIRNQVKVSTFLYLTTDPGELLVIGDVPNQSRPFRAFTAILETDRYPASYPWHCVLELDPKAREVRSRKARRSAASRSSAAGPTSRARCRSRSSTGSSSAASDGSRGTARARRRR